VWGILIRSEFGGHRVASGATELGRLHVLDGPVSDLGSNQHVQQRGDAKKPSQALKNGLAVEGYLRQSSLNPTLTQVEADWNQYQPGKENYRQYKENHNPGIGVVNVAANL
jgi:hypothetical protein